MANKDCNNCGREIPAGHTGEYCSGSCRDAWERKRKADQPTDADEFRTAMKDLGANPFGARKGLF